MGQELARRFTHGNHAYIVATHTDKQQMEGVECCFVTHFFSMCSCMSTSCIFEGLGDGSTNKHYGLWIFQDVKE